MSTHHPVADGLNRWIHSISDLGWVDLDRLLTQHRDIERPLRIPLGRRINGRIKLPLQREVAR